MLVYVLLMLFYPDHSTHRFYAGIPSTMNGVQNDIETLGKY